MNTVQIVIRVSNLQELSSFYETVLRPLSIVCLAKSDNGTYVTFGTKKWLSRPLSTKRFQRRPPCIILVAANSPIHYVGGVKMMEEGKTLIGNADDAEQDLGLMEAAMYMAPDHISRGGSAISRDINLQFEVFDREQVKLFQEVATAAGAKIVFPAGYRPEKGKYYYSATIEDVDGHRIEVASTRARFMWVVGLVVWVYNALLKCYFVWVIAKLLQRAKLI